MEKKTVCNQLEYNVDQQSLKQSATMSWLNGYFERNFYSSLNLNDEQWKPILHFSLIWNLFETNACYKKANEVSIRDSVSNNLANLEDGKYENHFEFFRGRYFPNQSINEKFGRLFPEGKPKTMKQHLEKILPLQDNSKEDTILGLLFIAYRIRNNFFHGNKSIVNLLNQTDLFQEVNQILMDYIDDITKSN